MKEALNKRETDLVAAILQLQEQEDWARDRGMVDLRDAYTAGYTYLSSKLQEIQRLLAQFN